MRTLLTLVVTLLITSCSAQVKSTGLLKGKVDIGPLCPQEPCNPSAERLKQVYASYLIVVADSANEKDVYQITIQDDGSFQKELPPGQYFAWIKPVTGGTFYTKPLSVHIYKKKTATVLLEYDTGMR